MRDSSLRLGLDLGSVGVKACLLAPATAEVVRAWSRPSRGEPVAGLVEILEEVRDVVEPGASIGARVTGAAAALVGDEVVAPVNELAATAAAIGVTAPRARSIIDLGGSLTRWIRLSPPARGGGSLAGVADFAINGRCAAGSGAFLEQQAARLGVTLETLGEQAASARAGATIAGRCSVFAKSDMIHLQQKGTPQDEIAYGLCLALARTFAATLLQGREVEPPLAFVGGGAANPGLRRALVEVLGLEPSQLLVPDEPALVGAFGAALLVDGSAPALDVAGWVEELRGRGAGSVGPGRAGAPVADALAPLRRPSQPGVSLDAVGGRGPGGAPPRSVYLGFDVGSVSTNVAVLDDALEVVTGLYLKTRGRPVEALDEALSLLARRLDAGVTVRGVGATGSGRYLAARLLGADVIENEITAQLRSASRYVPEVDTIFEIGGQDSKLIDARGGRLRDFEMNKICAAGTGSFLEEQAERLGISVERELEELAFAGRRPVDLGSRCTVFMDAELGHALSRGVPLTDLCAGLAIAVARNYLEKVVAGREVGEVILFQGGTAANAAVVSAFEALLGREVRVHPYGRISGAIGAALLAAEASPEATAFRGFEACRAHETTSFECGRCENRCQVNRVRAGDRVAHFGDVCERYTARDRGSARAGAGRPFPELFAARASLFEEHLTASKGRRSRAAPWRRERRRVGLVAGSLMAESLPFWSALLDALGCEVVLGRGGKDAAARGARGLPPEVCLPLKLANGRARELLEGGDVESVLLPSVLELEPRHGGDRCATCLYAQQLPDMAKLSWGDRVVVVQLSAKSTLGALPEAQAHVADALGLPVRRVRRAWQVAAERQRAFDDARLALGRRALAAVGPDSPAVVVLGKPYNLHDPLANLDLARHLDRVGLPAIPMDLLPLDGRALGQAWCMLPWQLSRDQVRALGHAAERRWLFPLHLSSYGCGPDAFTLKHLERAWGDRPRLFLEVDEHRGEAGLVTRLEAFAREIEEHRAHRGGTFLPLREPPARDNLDVPRGTRCFLPYTTAHVHAYAGVLRSAGMRAEVLPPPDAETLRLGEAHASGRECHPYALIAGDLVKLAGRDDLRKGDRFFVPSTRLPCLLPQYGDGFRSILERLGEERLRVFDQHPGEARAMWGLEGMLALYDGSTVVDYLIIAAARRRPREVERGSIELALGEGLRRLEDTLAAGGDPRDALVWAADRLRRVPVEPEKPRPLVGVTGDLYTRINVLGNDGLFSRLEAAGCTVWPSPFYAASTDFETPRNAVRWLARREVTRALKDLGGALVLRRRAARLAAALDDDLRRWCVEPPQPDLQRLATRYVSADSNHLVRGLVAKMADFAARGADGVISAVGINCMVGVAAAAAIPKIRADQGGVPIVSMAFGAGGGPMQDAAFDAFIDQVWRRFESRRR